MNMDEKEARRYQIQTGQARMTMKEKRAWIKEQRKIVSGIIAGFAKGGQIAAGLASEGYNGGYRDALSDVELLLNGIYPNERFF